MAKQLWQGHDRIVYLVRHGEAASKAEDSARPLTGSGRQAAGRIARWAAAAGLAVDQIRHSGKLRAQQTAEIFAEHFRPAAGIVAAGGLGPDDDVRPTAQSLQHEDRPVMLVGHLPFLGRLAGHLVIGQPDESIVQFEPAALVVLGQREGRWSILCAMSASLLP